MAEDTPAPAVSAEARRLMNVLGNADWWSDTRKDTQARLLAYVAGLETEVAISRAADAHALGLPSGTYDQNDLRRAFKAGSAQSKILTGHATLAAQEKPDA